MPGKTKGNLNNLINNFINNGLIPLVLIIMLIFFVRVDYLGQSNGPFNRIVNGIMVIIVTAVLLYAHSVKFRRIKQISKQLNDAVKTIKADYNEADGYLWEQYKDQDASRLFTDPDLLSSYRSYQTEKKRLEQNYSSYHVCKIEDYLNQELIEALADKNLMSIIPGILTGLGILGTFIGLTHGLQFFSTKTADEMMDSIAPLMEGIKVAFHTSIYGMASSLAFNSVYKNTLEAAYDSLDDFQNTFKKYVSPDNESDGISQLIYSQHKQADAVVDPIVNAVQTMNENIEKILSIQKLQHDEIKRMPEELGEMLGKRLGEIMIPQFQNANQSLETFAENISAIQVSGMGNLVNSFVSQMNDSLAGRFTELSEVINKTSELQKQNNEYVQELFIRLGEMTVDTKKISELNSETVSKMSENVQTMRNIQGRLLQNFSTVTEILDTNKQTVQEQHKYMEMLVEHQEKAGQVTQTFTRSISQELERLENLQNGLLENAKSGLETLSQSANEYNRALSEEAKKNFGEITEISNTFRVNTSREIENSYRHAQLQNQELSEAVKKEINSIHLQSQELSEAARKEIDSVKGQLDTTNNEMFMASKELGLVTKQLNEQTQESLVSTFKVFDEELAKITTHLSNTIKDVESTTEQVPKVVSAAYENMGKSFDDMQRQMESMIHMLDIMQRNMPDAVKKILAEEVITPDEGNENGETT